MKINSVSKVKGTLSVPGDKSISHRAVMLGSIAKGNTSIKGFLMGEDCLSTIKCFRQMGINISVRDSDVLVEGKGLAGLKKPSETLYVGNSGTTLRLMSGILSAQPFECTITGDDSIQKRPMKRIIDPLTNMGANIISIKNNDKAPLRIVGSELNNITYESPVASAQVKSSIMLASLYTDGITKIIEPSVSRNHSEIMLNYFGANVETVDNTVICNPVKELYGQEVIVPGDISSAAFFMVAGLILPNSEILIKNVGINPTRDGIITALKNMNGNIELLNIRTISGELTADILVKSSKLHGTVIEKDIIPKLIDEIPVIAVAACFAEGKTVIKDAAELKVKESNRIEAMVTELTKMDATIESTDDGMIITGTHSLKGASVESYHDHRIAMSLAIAALTTNEGSTISNSECIDISFPTFFEDLSKLCS